MRPVEKIVWIEAPSFAVSKQLGTGIQIAPTMSLGTAATPLVRITTAAIGSRGGMREVTIFLDEVERAALIEALGGAS